MAPTRGRYTSILIDGVNLDSQSNNVEIQTQNGVIDVTTFQADGKQFLGEPTEGSIRHQGYITAIGASTIEQVTFNRLGTSTNYIAVLLDTTIAACPAYAIHNTQGTELQLSAPAASVMTVQGNWTVGSEGGIKRGKRLFDGTISSTGNQTHIDVGTPGVDGFLHLHVTSIAGTATNADFSVESDDNSGFSSPTDHGSILFSGANGYALEIIGTIGRYVRLVANSLGGATSITATAVIISAGGGTM